MEQLLEETTKMFVCCKCGYESSRGTVLIDDKGETREYCKLHNPYRLPIKQDHNIFEGGFTLQNVHDENNKKVVVNSVKELREAEKRHHFALGVLSQDGDHINDAPKHEEWAGDLTKQYDWKWAKDPSRQSDSKGVEVGSAAREKLFIPGVQP